MSGSRPEREIVIIGYGLEYLVMALNCAASIRASNPGLATTLVTDIAVDPAAVADRFDRVVHREEPAERNRFVKTSILDHTVAERVVYVDADSEVVGDLGPLFTLLDRFDIVLKMHSVPVNKPFELTPDIPGGVFGHFSGGLLVLRDSEAARGFLAHWQDRMIESGLARDQPALARTVYDLPDLRLAVVNAVWCADEWEAATLFTAKREPPRVRHYARPHLDEDVARRLRATFDALAPALPPERRDDVEAERVRAKYRLITHPLFRLRWTRRPLLGLAHRWAVLRGRDLVSISDRGSRTQGHPYTREAGRLWAD